MPRSRPGVRVVGAVQPGQIDPSFKTAVRVLQSRLTLRIPRAGIVERRALIHQLKRASDAGVVAVVAPAGYGKTTLLAQWAGRDPRRFASLSFDRSFNDPAVLLTYLTFALAQAVEVGPEVFECLIALHPPERAEVLAGLAAAVARSPTPFVLVLDDVHLLTDAEGIQALNTLAEHVPQGSQLAVAARREPPLQLARTRSEGGLLEIGAPDLRFDTAEARELLAATGMVLPSNALADLISRTDGWPVALYLAGLAGHSAPLPEMRRGWFAGDDRVLADYIRAEFLDRLSADEILFLTRTSVLEELCGPLCDATLDRSGSAAVLEAIEESNLLLIPLDRQRRWYRYVQVFREMLRHELDRAEPEAAQVLLSRASDWCAENGHLDDAIRYAQLAADLERVEDILTRHGLRQYAMGRAAALRNWLGWLTDHDSHNGGIAVIGAWLSLMSGRPAEAERLTMIADRAPPDVTLPDGSTLQAWVKTLQAAMAVDAEHMRSDAKSALDRLAPSSQWRPTAAVLLGSAELFQGDVDSADMHLADAVELGERLGGPAAAALALATRALIAIRRGRWDQAAAFLDRSSTMIDEAHQRSYATSALTFAVAARVAMNAADTRTARENAKNCEQLLPLLTRALPHLAIETRLQLIRAYLALGDPQAATTRLAEVDELLLRNGAEFGALRQETDELTTTLEKMRSCALEPLGLTPAELRLLPHLATQQSFREIAEELFVSVHTIKAQVTSIYRKLGTSSRTQAIEQARKVGLLPP